MIDARYYYSAARTSGPQLYNMGTGPGRHTAVREDWFTHQVQTSKDFEVDTKDAARHDISYS